MNLTCHLTQSHDAWTLSDSTIKQILHQVLGEFTQLAGYDVHVDITLTDDDDIQTLNREYRGKDKPTNVLSFPQFESWEDLHPASPNLLGDIVLSYSTIKRESVDQEKSFEDHCTHLLVHGCLHLLGFDHMEPFDAEEMESLEIQILAKLGVSNPYGEDSAP